jgi:3-oxoacyl-[acyl-carrier-protein] synthase II
VEVIASLISGEAGVYPITTGFGQPRDGCSLDYITEKERPWKEPKIFLSNNAAFGGHNASLAVKLVGQQPAAAPEQPADSAICLTGCGVVTALGVGVETLRETLQTDRSGLRPGAFPGLAPRQAGWVDAQAVERYDRRLDLRNMDRSSRWATVAARLAMREAGYPEKPREVADLGLFLHLATGPTWAESEFLSSYFSHGRQVNQLMAFPFIVPCSVVGNVCRVLRLTGHNLTLSLGPGAGLLGLWPAMAALQNGHTEAILSGAVDELSERIIADQNSANPGTENQRVLGEGGAFFMLETERHAQARGARVLAKVSGTAVCYNEEEATDPDSAVLSVRKLVDEALEKAGIKPDEVGCLCLQAPSRIQAELKAKLWPGWPGKVVTLRDRTGWLEGAQPLVDMAAALYSLDQKRSEASYILAVLSSPHGMRAVFVWRGCTCEL